MPRLTLVTALFDLARREPGSRRHAPEHYLSHAWFVLGLGCDLLVYADPELVSAIEARRAAAGRTRVVPIRLEELESHGRIGALRDARAARPLVNGDPIKDTPLHAVLGRAKFELLERTLAVSPFGATHVAWIDLGVAHVARTRHCLEDGVFARPADRVRLLMTGSPRPAELADRHRYLSHVWGHAAAGYVPGPCDAMAELCRLVRAEDRAAQELGHAATDEQLLTIVAAENPDLVEVTYGDYEDLLDNHLVLRGGVENLLFQLRGCRSPRGWDRARARALAERVVHACRERTITSDRTRLPELLEEAFLALWAADYPSPDAAREAAALYRRLVDEEPEFRDAFLRHEIRVRSNFAIAA